MHQTLDLRLLRTFVLAARTHSISGTAVQVLRSQSAVTMQIQRLEAALEQTLFHRSGNGIFLTKSGERFLPYAEKVLRTHDVAISDFASRGLNGSISFGCPEDYLIAFGPNLLRSFGALHSAIEITVVSAPTLELQSLLGKRQLDLALISIPDPASADSILRSEPLVWVGNKPDLALYSFDTVLPLALSASNTMDHRAAREVLNDAGIGYRISFASNSLAGLTAIARSGLAIAVFTNKAVPPDLFVLDKFLPALPQLGVSVSYAATEPPEIVRTFGEHIEQHCRVS
ncbi:MAG: LysR family transcriptional regulator [Sulfitobacter sp.]